MGISPLKVQHYKVRSPEKEGPYIRHHTILESYSYYVSTKLLKLRREHASDTAPLVHIVC